MVSLENVFFETIQVCQVKLQEQLKLENQT